MPDRTHRSNHAFIKNVQNVGLGHSSLVDGRGRGCCRLWCDRFRMCCLFRVGRCFCYEFGVGSLFWRGLRMVFLVVVLDVTSPRFVYPRGFLWCVVTRCFGSDRSIFGYRVQRGVLWRFFFGCLGWIFRFVLIGVIVGKYYRFRFGPFCGLFPFGLVLLEVVCHLDLTYVEVFQDLHYFLGWWSAKA